MTDRIAMREGRRPCAGAHGLGAYLLLAVLCAVVGCGAGAKATGPAPAASQASAGPSVPRSEGKGPSGGQRFDASPTDLVRLEQVYEQRTAGPSGGDYPIGPGDLVEVSVPSMAELHAQSMRVAGDGTLALPLLGNIQAAGRSERQLHDDVAARLGRYMYRPEFSLVIREHRNRQVGVLGAVETPGLHAVDGGRDTILEMISKAGGLTEEATQRLLFMPVETVSGRDADQLAASGLVVTDAAPTGGATAAGVLLKAGRPIVIDLDKMNESSQRFALNVPVRPGDTIMALGGGQVFVQGWVKQPGAYPMKRGLTALGAIGAAGGLSYPADKSSVRVLREENGTERAVVPIDLEQVETGRAEDIALREGDLIEVEAEGAKLAAYGVYHFFTNVMQMGFAVSPF
jgi:polysaccharide biosynthesis/export protein